MAPECQSFLKPRAGTTGDPCVRARAHESGQKVVKYQRNLRTITALQMHHGRRIVRHIRHGRGLVVRQLPTEEENY
jgi:hypothetical protein